MENKSMGQLIQSLRKEKGLTQKQLADKLNITDKAVSKWERDLACPDTATLPKLADILEVRVESLLNAKIEAVPENSVLGNVDDTNPFAEIYRERVKQLLRKGILGFVIGFAFLLFVIIVTQYFPKNGVTFETVTAALFIALLGGVLYAGVPYGWGLVNKFLSQWTVFGNVLVMIFLFALKFLVACCIGCFGYPIVLIYNIIRSQKTNRRVRIWGIIAVTAVILWYVFLGLYVCFAS